MYFDVCIKIGICINIHYLVVTFLSKLEKWKYDLTWILYE